MMVPPRRASASVKLGKARAVCAGSAKGLGGGIGAGSPAPWGCARLAAEMGRLQAEPKKGPEFVVKI